MIAGNDDSLLFALAFQCSAETAKGVSFVAFGIIKEIARNHDAPNGMRDFCQMSRDVRLLLRCEFVTEVKIAKVEDIRALLASIPPLKNKFKFLGTVKRLA